MNRDAKMLNEKGVMTRLVTVECCVLTGSLHTVIKVHRLFKRHRFDLMARDWGSYRVEIVREFYASYVTTLQGSLDRRARHAKHDPLTYTLVRVFRVDISESTICQF